ncbi:MAG: hypothetical protein HYV27_04420 [Candidatus Hydrogenedentes bacterium]|nr:hypothetical protein [Candidatus Hydrogenedentota bacterium]
MFDSTRASRQGWITRIPRDGAIAVLLFLAGACVGMLYCLNWGGKPLFWQNTTFMQAIMWVCGHGFENPMVSDVPGLEAFLDGNTDCFDCAAIPGDVRVLPEDTSAMSFEEIDAWHPQDQFPGFLPWQRYHLYLVLTVAAFWSIFGVCWSALVPLCGLLYGAAIAAAFGIFRLGVRRSLATFFAFMLMISPLHLQMLPHIRDYAKAPFLLLAILIMGLLLRESLHRNLSLLLSAFCGALLGIGIGFRTDLAIAVPAFLLALPLAPVESRAGLRWRLFAGVTFILAFIGAGYPILQELAKESGHFAHVTLLGFLNFCDRRLGVAAPLYHLGDPFSDFYLANAVQSYMHRIHGTMPETHVMMPPYHEATNFFLMEYIKTFPGDLILRAYTAVLRILDEMHPKAHAPYPQGITAPWLLPLFDLRALLLDRLPGGGRYYAGIALGILAARNLRWGFGALLLLLFFGGYPSLQFNLRHAFHLEFLSLWAFAFLLQRGLDVCGIALSPDRRSGLREQLVHHERGIAPSLLRFAIFGAVTVSGLALLLQGTRLWQHRAVAALVEQCVAAPLEALVAIPSAGGDVTVLFDLGDFGKTPPLEQFDLPVHYEYLMVTCAGGEGAIPLTFVYEAEHREHFNYTRTVTAPLKETGDGVTRLYFPLYFGQDSRFAGVRVPQAQAEKVTGFYRVHNAQEIPLWMTLILPPDWKDLPLHQSMTR